MTARIRNEPYAHKGLDRPNGVDGPREEMALSDLLWHCAAHPPADPLTARLVEAADAEISGLEDDLCAEQDRREETERQLAEAKARIERLEGVLESEGVLPALWR